MNKKRTEMRKILSAATMMLVTCICQKGLGATWYVKSSVGASGDGSSWETALKTIQKGISGASPGDMVVVAEGIYVENIEFKGKNITLTRTDPFGPSIVATPSLTALNAARSKPSAALLRRAVERVS